jgi:hypothetical protein
MNVPFEMTSALPLQIKLALASGELSLFFYHYARARAIVLTERAAQQTPAYSIRGNAKEKAVNNPNKDGLLEIESQRRMDNTAPGIKY